MGPSRQPCSDQQAVAGDRTVLQAMIKRDHLSIEEFSQQSGLAVVTIRRYVQKGRIPFVQPGGRKHRILIPIDALHDLQNPVPTQPAEPTPQPAAHPVRSGPKPRWFKGPRSH